MDWNIFNWRSLKTRVTLFTLAIFLIGIWSLVFYASLILREDMRRLLGEQQFSTVSLLAAQVNQELDDRLSALEMLAGKVSPVMPRGTVALQKLLDDFQALQGRFGAGVFVTRIDGTVIADASLSGKRIGVNYMDREFIAGPLKEGKPMIGRPVIGRTLRTPVFGIAVPIRDIRGDVIGALAGITDLSKPNFLDKITQSHYGKTGGYFLAVPQYRLNITATDKSHIMQPLPAPGVSPPIDRFVQGYEGSDLYVNPLGVEVLVSVKRIPVADWTMVASLPTAEAFAPIQNMQRHMFLAAIFLTVSAGSVTWWMTWWLLRRQLSPMLAATKTLATLPDTNQPPQPLHVTSQDEIGELIGGFNRLLRTLAQREEALIESERLLKESQRIASLGSYVLDVPTGSWTCSDVCNRVFGIGEAYEHSVEGWAALIHPDERATVVDYYRKDVLGRGHTFDKTYRIVRHDDRAERWVHEFGRLEFDAQGHPVKMLGTIQDITDRMRLEAAHLQAQKLESLGRLTGGIAHDFNNILAAIKGNADLAAGDIGHDHPASESLEEIRRASTRASELVRRIMAFGRPGEARREAVDLGAVVNEVLKLLRSALPAGISLQREFAADIPQVLADAGQIHEAVVNLTTNAAYAIGPRAGSIEYRLEPVEVADDPARGIPGIKTGRYARLTVTDSGCGMDAAMLERIFDAFYTTKPVGEGTGLGLSMVHGIMRSHGGAVTVQSTPGKGSSFALYFPSAGEKADKEKASAPARRLPATGLRVMYVDDEEALVSLGNRVFSRLGHGISVFNDPREALEAFRAHPRDFDIVVTDLSMPHISGFQLARAILAARPEMPVLMITGNIRAEDEGTAREIGIREIILKPFGIDELGCALDRIFRDTDRANMTR